MKNLLKIHEFAFLKLLTYRILMVLAYQMLAVVVGWHIYEITHDPLSLGLIGLAEVIPYFSTALFAGYAIDHHLSRRFFAMLAALMLFTNALILTSVSAGWLEVGTQKSIIFWIYASIAFTGFARAFIAPSYNTLFAIIIPRKKYAQAAGMGSAMFQIGLILGPAIGGLLVGFTSKTFAYSVAASLCFAGFIAMASIKIQEPKAPEERLPVFKSIHEGLKFVFSNQIILSAISLDMFAVLFGGAVAMLPAFIHDIYQLGPESLGVLRAAPAIGAIFTGFWLAKHPIDNHAGRWLLGTVAAFGVCMIGFGLSINFWMAAIMLALSGVFDGISVVMRQTILQLATPDAMRGRVSAINGIFIGSSNELGAFESGVAARLLGLVPSVIFGGVATLAVVGIVAKLAPQLRRLELEQLH
jgi:MFS family permease